MTPNSSPGGDRDHLGGATNEPPALAQRPAGFERPLERQRRPARHGTRGARHGAPACIGLGTRVYPRRAAISHGPWARTAPPTMLRVASTQPAGERGPGDLRPRVSFQPAPNPARCGSDAISVPDRPLRKRGQPAARCSERQGLRQSGGDAGGCPS
jgi:hypothetical protein